MSTWDATDTLSSSTSWLLSLALIGLISTIWLTSHYWRILVVRWVATLSVFLHIVASQHSITRYQLGSLGLLCLVLFLWSLILTPVQLFLQRKAVREPTATYHVLYDPTQDGTELHDIKVDVVAVHGLASWSEFAWTAPNDVNWLRDLLPVVWSDMRIIVLNHNSRWDAFSPDDCDKYVDQTALVIQAETCKEQDRPIVMIGHSFGGILVKKALVMANEATDSSGASRIAKNTQAFLFLGTPHKGSNFALIAMLSSYFSYWRGSRSELLEFLTPGSRELEDLHQAFLQVYNGTYICNFFETSPIKLGSLSTKPVVSQRSAMIEGHPIFPLDADHRGLNKFKGDSDDNFLIVKRQLSEARTFIQSKLADEKQRNRYSVPFRLRGAARVGTFIGRKDLLEKMFNQMFQMRHQQRQGTLVLTGLGGMGKTQLAIEFAIQNREKFSAVFWVGCHTSVTARFAFANIAEQIPLPEVLDSNGKVSDQSGSIDRAVAAVKDWLEQTANSSWLLILDGLDQLPSTRSGNDHEADTADFDIRDCLPSSSHGTVVITTRYERLAQLGFKVEVAEVSTEDGTAIFLNCAGKLRPEQEIEKLIQRVGGLPLAISQAGTYINETGISVGEYLNSFNSRLEDLLSGDSDLTYKNSIRASLDMSVSALKERDPIAVNLLHLWGFLDNTDLWHGLFALAKEDLKGLSRVSYLVDGDMQSEAEWQAENQDFPYEIPENPHSWLDKIAADENEFLKAIRSLRGFSLARKVDETDGYSIHPIVHEFARASLPKDRVAGFLGATVQLVGKATPLLHERDAWMLQRRLFTHADRFWTVFEEEQGQVAATLAAAEGFHGLAYFEFDRGNFDHVSTAYDYACESLRGLMGVDDPLTIKCLHDQSLLFRQRGQYDKATERLEWAYEHSCEVEGPLSRTAVRALDDLGRVAALQGDHETAVKYFEQAFERKPTAWKGDQVVIYDSARHLGLAYMEIGKLDEAEKLQVKVLEVFREELGQTHPWTMLALSDLATLYGKQDRYQEAETLLEAALDSVEKALGSNNPKTEEVGLKLIKVLEKQDKMSEAASLRQRLDQKSATSDST